MSIVDTKNTNINNRSRERGFVLLEYLISVGFMATIGALVLNMLAQGWEVNSRNEAILEVSVTTSTSTTWLVRDIHVATGTDIADGGGTQATAQFTWTDAGGAHVCDYALVSGDLQRTCDSVSWSTGDNISNITFERSGDLVTISYDVTAPNRADVADSVVLNVALGAG